MLSGSLTAFEHQRIPVGIGRGDGALSAAEAERLALVSQNRQGFCTPGYQSVRLAQYAGLVGMGSRVLEILPKVETEDGSPQLGRGIFLRLLRRSRSLKIFTDAQVQQDLRRQSLLDVFIAAFFDEIATVVRKGLLRRYQSQEDDLQVIRGRLLIARQATTYAMRIDRLACRFDELTADNVWNRSLKAALHCVKPWITSIDLRRRWLELSTILDEVSLCPVTPMELEALAFDRQAEYYRPAILWAKWIVQLLSPNLRFGRNDAPGLLFDMNQLFESAIATTLKLRAAAYPSMEVGVQDTGNYLARLSTTDGKPSFKLRPDIVIREAGEVLAVADTKWTCVEVGRDGHLTPSEAHIYQMQAYASVYACEHFTLIYPWHQGLIGSKPTAYYLPIIGHRKPVLSIVTVDVGSDTFNASTSLVGSAIDRLLKVAG